MDLKVSFLNFNFGKIYIIHKILDKILVLIKICPNYLQDKIFELFLRSITDFFLFSFFNFFHNI